MSRGSVRFYGKSVRLDPKNAQSKSVLRMYHQNLDKVATVAGLVEKCSNKQENKLL